MKVLNGCVLALCLTGLVACSSHKTVSANGTTVTTDDDNKNVTINTKEGSETIGKNAVDLSKLDVPVYPGAQASEGGVSVAAASGSTQMVALTTTDAFDKVYDWYKSQMPKDAEKMKVSTGDSSMAEFTTGADAKGSPQSTVTITGKKDKTEIMIIKGTKN